MSTEKRPHEEVVSSVIARLENMTREEWQERLDRVAGRFHPERMADRNGERRIEFTHDIVLYDKTGQPVPRPDYAMKRIDQLSRFQKNA